MGFWGDEICHPTDQNERVVAIDLTRIFKYIQIINWLCFWHVTCLQVGKASELLGCHNWIT